MNRSIGKANKVDFPNYSAVLFLNGYGAEQPWEWEDEINVSGICMGIE
jgi:hypothetical protein